MKHRKHALLGVLALLGLLLFGCAAAPGAPVPPDELISADETWAKAGGAAVLRDTAARYAGENEPQVVTLYLTVGQGNAADGTNHTWAEVNDYPLAYYEQAGTAPYRCEAVLQVGDEAGPLAGAFGYGERAANATVRLRGAGASRQPQKSYRIEIKSGKGSWEEQKVIVLNKQSTDPLRFKNRLGYALLQRADALFSCRTRFVHLYVKDKTQGEDGLFEDYGLYTQVEQPNKAYLKAHGLDKDGALYQAERFDWARHPDALRLATEPGFSQQAFEQYLEIKGSDDHTKLLALLDAVNDETTPVSQLVERYFDPAHLYQWLAFQILTGNRDAATGGYYLYSPQMLDRWYLISWNHDGMLGDSCERLRDPGWTSGWSHGIFPFAQSVLFRRMLRDDTCRAALDEAVEALRAGCLAPAAVTALAQPLAAAAKPYVYALPDRTFARVTAQDYDFLVRQLPAELEEHYQAYRASLAEPWPFHILAPERAGSETRLRWQASYLHGAEQSVRYTVELARSPDFADCLLRRTGVAGTGLMAGTLAPGQYFLRVRAAAPSGETQDAYETYYAESGAAVHSTVCFYVLAGGGIEVSAFDTEE